MPSYCSRHSIRHAPGRGKATPGDRRGRARRIRGLRRQRDGRAWRYEPTGSRSGYTAALMSEALATNPDRRTALAHFVLQMSPHDAALLREALDQAYQPPEEGGTR